MSGDTEILVEHVKEAHEKGEIIPWYVHEYMESLGVHL